MTPPLLRKQHHQPVDGLVAAVLTCHLARERASQLTLTACPLSDLGSAAATNRVAALMSDIIELTDVAERFERWLAGRPLAERSRRE